MPGGTTAHTLAPSKEALDTPLSPRPLDHEPGSATGLSDDYPDGTRTRWSGPACRTQHAAERMGVRPSGCAVVEDSPYGIAAAVAAGMTPYGFSGSVIPADRLAADGATVFDSMADLPGLVIAQS